LTLLDGFDAFPKNIVNSVKIFQNKDSSYAVLFNGNIRNVVDSLICIKLESCPIVKCEFGLKNTQKLNCTTYRINFNDTNCIKIFTYDTLNSINLCGKNIKYVPDSIHLVKVIYRPKQKDSLLYIGLISNPGNSNKQKLIEPKNIMEIRYCSDTSFNKKDICISNYNDSIISGFRYDKHICKSIFKDKAAIFWTNKKGDQLIKWGTTTNTPRVNVGSRPYFRKVVTTFNLIYNIDFL